MPNYRGALTYNFNTNPKNIKPFARVKFPKSPYFAWIYQRKAKEVRGSCNSNSRSTRMEKLIFY